MFVAHRFHVCIVAAILAMTSTYYVANGFPANESITDHFLTTDNATSSSPSSSYPSSSSLSIALATSKRGLAVIREIPPLFGRSKNKTGKMTGILCDGIWCLNRYCISSDMICDGESDCPDGSDEAICPRGQQSAIDLQRSKALKFVICLIGVLSIVLLFMYALWPETDRSSSSSSRRNYPYKYSPVKYCEIYPTVSYKVPVDEGEADTPSLPPPFGIQNRLKDSAATASFQFQEDDSVPGSPEKEDIHYESDIRA